MDEEESKGINLSPTSEITLSDTVHAGHVVPTTGEIGYTMRVQEDSEDEGECEHHRGRGGHQHSQHCQHGENAGGEHAGHNHGGRGGHNHGRGHGKNNCIIGYVHCLIISNFLMHWYAFGTIYTGFERIFADFASLFFNGMTLWAYTITRRSQNSRPPKLKGIKNFQPRTHLDPTYDLTRQCKKCDNFKFPRVSHCSTCRSCIYRLDHHCIWTQNCIGIRNYRPFFLFVGYAWMGAVVHLYYMYHYFNYCYGQPSFWAMHSTIFFLWWIAQTVSVIFMGIMIGALLFGHVFLAATNFTSLDSMKTKICCSIPFLEYRKPQLNLINLYDRGQIKNILNLLGNSLLFFWIPYQAEIDNEITPEKMNPEPTQAQIKLWNQQIRKQQFDRESQMKRLVQDTKELFKGKKMRINGKVITLA